MNFIGVVFHELNGYSSKLLEGVLFRLEQLGYQAIVKLVREEQLEIRDTIGQLISTGVKGVILCSPHLDEEMLQSMKNTMAPILLLDHCLHLPGFLTMEFDNTVVVREAAQLLWKQGKTVGLVTGPRRFGSEKTCWTGFTEALAQSKTVDRESVFDMELPFQREALYKTLLAEIPAREELPDCFIISNEFMADCMRETLFINGRRGHMFYVLSGQSFEQREVSDVVLLKRDAVSCARKAVDILHAQICEPMVNDSPGETSVPQLDTSRIIPVSFLRQVESSQRTLRVLLPDAPMSRSIQLLKNDFINKTGINVEFFRKNMTQLRQEIIDSCGQEKPTYDVVTFHINWLSEFGRKGYLKKLDEWMDFARVSQEYFPKVQKAYFKGAYAGYGIPAEMGVQVLAYRDDIFSDPVVQKNYYSEVGLELQPPRSWTEFNIIAKYFTRRYNPASPVKYGTCIAGHIPTGLVEEFWPRSLAFRGKFFENQNPAFCTPQNIKALENLCDSYRYSYPDCRTFMDSEQVQEMLSGDIAMIVTYYSYMVLNSTGWGKRIKFSRTPSNMTVIDSYLLGIPAGVKEPWASSAFIEWCCSDDVALKSVLLGRLTPKTNVILNGEIEYFNQGIKDMFDNIETMVSRDQIFNGVIDDPLFNEMMASKLAEAVYEGVSAEKVMKELQRMFATR
ncbi:MAG: extracellular solute-binding protein [Eubacteriales bacterium]|nr:extracellular solute-binding protein [Eubacteriales bacterium]